jgi:N utilization substance protein B
VTARSADRVARGRAASKRRAGREMALQMLYQREMGGATTPQVLLHYNPVDLLEAVRDETEEDTLVRLSAQPEQMREALLYAKRLVEGTAGHLEELDELIRVQAENWRLERMSAVDRNVLRLAIYELLYETDVPKLVVLDEAIELAKRFGSEQSGRFVNGLLDGLLRSHHFPGRMT